MIIFVSCRRTDYEPVIWRLVKKEDGQLLFCYSIFKSDWGKLFISEIKMELPTWSQKTLIGSVIAGPIDGARTFSGQTHDLGQWKFKRRHYSHIDLHLWCFGTSERWRDESLLSPLNSMSSYLRWTPLFL